MASANGDTQNPLLALDNDLFVGFLEVHAFVTQLGTPKSSLWTRFLPPCTRPSRGSPRTPAVAPLIPDQRCYGGGPVGLRSIWPETPDFGSGARR